MSFQSLLFRIRFVEVGQMGWAERGHTPSLKVPLLWQDDQWLWILLQTTVGSCFLLPMLLFWMASSKVIGGFVMANANGLLPTCISLWSFCSVCCLTLSPGAFFLTTYTSHCSSADSCSCHTQYACLSHPNPVSKSILVIFTISSSTYVQSPTLLPQSRLPLQTSPFCL